MKVSVLLPVRDGEATLATALRSLRRQTFEDFEIVAVDDGSTDGTGELLRAWRRREPRLRILTLEPRGLVAALEHGRRHCRGELVARMDADDAMLPRRLEQQVERLDRARDLDLVACRVRCFPRRRIAGGFALYERWLNGLVTPEDHRRERFIESPVAHPSVMVRRRVLEDVGGYRDRGWAEDYDLWLRLLERGHRFEKIPEILHLWRDHPGRQTRVDRRYSKKQFLACKAHFLVRGPLRARALDGDGDGEGSILVWGAGPTGRTLARELDRLGRPVEAFLDIDPKKLRKRPGGRPVHPVERLPELLRPGSTVLVAVARRGARELIRPHLDAAGLEDGRDAFFVA